MSDLREKVAREAGGYSETEWAAFIASADPLDALTVTNFRVIADRILAIPEIVEALECRDEFAAEGLIGSDPSASESA